MMNKEELNKKKEQYYGSWVYCKIIGKKLHWNDKVVFENCIKHYDKYLELKKKIEKFENKY